MLHALAPADELVIIVTFLEALFEKAVFPLESSLFADAVDHDFQALEVDRLLEVVITAHFERFDSGLDGSETGQNDDFRGGVDLLGGFEHVQTANFGHDQIGDDRGIVVALDLFDGECAGIGGIDLVVMAGQVLLDQIKNTFIVIHEQYRQSFHRNKPAVKKTG